MIQKQLNINKLNYNRNFYDFMRWNHVAYTILIILIITSITIISICGFNWGLNFTGGAVIELYLEKVTDLDQIRHNLKLAGFMDPLVQTLDNNHEVRIHIPLNHNMLQQNVSNKVLEIINTTTSHNNILKKSEFIGPSVGNDLVQDGGMALLVTLICVLIYISFRFEWRLAIGTILALVHDVIITLGIVSLCQIEINLTIIASLISVIGYSLNDSIVVFDRIRENFRKFQDSNVYDILNVSLTQVLRRTIITSATTLMLVLILLIFGGTILHGFSITLFIGILIGTISSIYVASTLALKLGIKREHLLLQQNIKKEGDNL